MLFRSVLKPAAWLTDYVYQIGDFFAAIPFGVLYCENTVDFLLSVLVSILMILMLWLANKRVLAICTPMITAVLIGVSLSRSNAAWDDWTVTVLSEGNGQAILVSCGDELALIDCSATGYHDAVEDIKQYMDWNNQQNIDLFILTSVDKSAARNASELLQEVPVDMVILPEENREKNAVYPKFMKHCASKTSRMIKPRRRTNYRWEIRYWDCLFWGAPSANWLCACNRNSTT